MAKMTVREFAKSVGLATSGADYIACTVMLKMLCTKGVAKEVDRINTSASGRGRKSVVYEIPEQVSFGLDTTAAFAAPAAPVAETVVEVVTEIANTPEFTVEVVSEVTPVEADEPFAEATEQKFCYDDDEDEAEAA